MSTDSSSARGSSHDTEKARVLPGAAETPKVTLVSRTTVALNVKKDTENRIDPQLDSATASKPSSDDAKLNATSDPLQVAAQQYPWMYMASTLDACFQDAQETAERDIKARSDALDTQEASISDQRARFETEQLIEFYGELSLDKFAKDAPKIMKNFLAHGDACSAIEAEALRVASQDLDNIDLDTLDIMVPLREYNELLDRLGMLQMEAFELESAILRLTVSTTTTAEYSPGEQIPVSDTTSDSSTSPSETNDHTLINNSGTLSQSTAARSQIAPVFTACLPIIRARGQNITMAQQLVEGAKQNLSMTMHLQSLGIGDNDEYNDDEED